MSSEERSELGVLALHNSRLSADARAESVQLRCTLRIRDDGIAHT